MHPIGVHDSLGLRYVPAQSDHPRMKIRGIILYKIALVAFVEITFDAAFVALNFEKGRVRLIRAVTFDLKNHLGVAIIRRDRNRNFTDRAPDGTTVVIYTRRINDLGDMELGIKNLSGNLDPFCRYRIGSPNR